MYLQNKFCIYKKLSYICNIKYTQVLSNMALSYKGYYCGLLIRLSWFESMWGRSCWEINMEIFDNTEIHRNLFCNRNCDSVGCLYAGVAQWQSRGFVNLRSRSRYSPPALNSMAQWWNGIHGRLKIYCQKWYVGSTPTCATLFGYVFCYF